MSNLLGVPGKASLPVEFAAALREHISGHFKDAHPDQFQADYELIRKLRAAVTVAFGSKQEIHASLLQQLITYHAQLVFILNKFPADIGVAFEWLPVFAQTSNAGLASSLPGMMPATNPVSLSDINYERASVLFNIAAMHASLGASETRKDKEGIKRALAHFQHAAGCFSLLSSNVVETIRLGPGEPSPCSPDFSKDALAALEHLCLAQAQECFWQQAVLDRLKNGTIAKLSARVAELYAMALENATAAKGASGTWPTFSFPSELLNHIMIKKAHFAAAAQYRKSCDDLSSNKYGDEIGRLRAAETALKEGLSASRRGVSNVVIDDLKSLQAIVADNLARAVKDNDLIYLDPVPSSATLAAIAPASMTKAVVPSAVGAPLEALHDKSGGLGRPVFEQLVPYAVHQAISVYSDRVETFIRTEVSARIEELDALAASSLQSLGLPGSIQALEAPIALPPGLLRKAAEVRAENGPSRLRSMLNDVQRLASSSQSTLDMANSLLDAEAADDARERSQAGSEWSRPTSAQAAGQLRARAERYGSTLQQAQASDAMVRQKYTEWEGRFNDLSRSEADLQSIIPSNAKAAKTYNVDPNPAQTMAVRQLRRHLEEIDKLVSARASLLADARRQAASDDIRPVILRNATTQGVSVAAFEPLLEAGLAKYARFEDDLAENAAAQQERLETIRSANDDFVQARKGDLTLRQREKALQNLDLAYSKYREVVNNLTEGLRFYNELGGLLKEHRRACQEWVQARRREAQDHVAALAIGASRLSLNDGSSDRSGPWRPEEGIRFKD